MLTKAEDLLLFTLQRYCNCVRQNMRTWDHIPSNI